MEDAGQGVISTIPHLNCSEFTVTRAPEDSRRRHHILDIDIDYVIRPAGRALEPMERNEVVRSALSFTSETAETDHIIGRSVSIALHSLEISSYVII